MKPSTFWACGPEGAVEPAGQAHHDLARRRARAPAPPTAFTSLRGPTRASVARPDASVARLVGERHSDPHVPHVETQERTRSQYSATTACLDTPGALCNPRRAYSSVRHAEPKYRILHELGAGGMGTVHKGVLVGQAGFQRPIVIKQLQARRTTRAHAAVRRGGAALRGARPREHRPHLRFRATSTASCASSSSTSTAGASSSTSSATASSTACPTSSSSVFIVSRVCRALQYVFERAAHRAPRHQPEQHHDDPRGHGEADRLRHRDAKRHERREPDRQARLHGARDGGRAARGQPQRRLLAWAPCSSRC